LPTIMAHRCRHPPPTHTFTHCSNTCELSLVRTWSGLHLPHVGLSPLCPAHLAMSPAPHILLTSLGPSLGSCPAHTHLVSLHIHISPVHLCPPPMSPHHILLTSLGPSGSLHAYASHLCVFPTSLCLIPHMSCHHISIQSCLTSRPLTCVGCSPLYISVGLTPVSQWMVCMARCGEVMQQRTVTS